MSWNGLDRYRYPYPHRHRHRHRHSSSHPHKLRLSNRRRILFFLCVWIASAFAFAFIAAEIKIKIKIGIGIASVDAMRISTSMSTSMRRIGMHSQSHLHPSYRVYPRNNHPFVCHGRRPIRVLSSFRGAQPQPQSQSQPQPPLSFSLLSVRRFASKDDIDLDLDIDIDLHSGNDDERDHPFLNATSTSTSTPNELSTLATSVRDRVTNLLSSTCTIPANNHRNNHNHNHTTRNRNRTVHILPIVVAVSGGCDSVALFHALMEWYTYTTHARNHHHDHHHHHHHHYNLHQQQEQLQEQLQLDITVVHFHHRQRPIDADEDCRLVRELVDKYNNNINININININSNSNNNNDAIPSQSIPSVAFRLEDWRDRDKDKDKDKDKETYTEENPSHSEAAGSSFSQDKARVWRRTKLQECAEERVRTLRRQYQSITVQDGDNDDDNDGNDDNDNDDNDHDELVSTIVPFGMVLTAHHDDDSYETVLIKLLRGVHLLNLHDKATISSVSLMQNYATGDLQQAQQQQQEEKESPAASPTADTLPIYLVRPFVTDTKANLAGHTKDDLIHYLVHRNLTWREDASNHDPHSKYLRNRVRRELIPLLRDLTEDSFRSKRIPALLEQSQHMAQDLEPRVEAYLASAVHVVRYDDDDGNDSEDSFFSILPRQSSDNDNEGASQDSTSASSSSSGNNSSRSSNIITRNSNSSNNNINSSQLVRSQALYKWMSMRVQEESRKSSRDNDSTISSSSSSSLMNISYESLQRVVQQLEDYPERQKWTLELGSGWTVERVGDFLRMGMPMPMPIHEPQPGSRRRIQSDSNRDKHSTSNRVWGWTRVGEKDDASIQKDFRNYTDEDTNNNKSNNNNSNCLFIQVPSAFWEANCNGECLEFVSTTLQKAEAEPDSEDDPKSGPSSSSPPSSLRFTPSWKTSRIKLRAFLRGQNVPVHLRDATQLLFVTYNTNADASDKRKRRRLVAVCIRKKWMVDREFHIAPFPAKDGLEESSRDNDSEAVLLQISKRED